MSNLSNVLIKVLSRSSFLLIKWWHDSGLVLLDDGSLDSRRSFTTIRLFQLQTHRWTHLKWKLWFQSRLFKHRNAEMYSRKSDVFRHNGTFKTEARGFHSVLLNLNQSCINNCSALPFSLPEWLTPDRETSCSFFWLFFCNVMHFPLKDLYNLI